MAHQKPSRDVAGAGPGTGYSVVPLGCPWRVRGPGGLRQEEGKAAASCPAGSAGRLSQLAAAAFGTKVFVACVQTSFKAGKCYSLPKLA